MKSYEIFQQMSPSLAGEILSYLQKERTPVFKSVVQTLASQRNLRTVFVERDEEPWQLIPAAAGSSNRDALPVVDLAMAEFEAWLGKEMARSIDLVAGPPFQGCGHRRFQAHQIPA